MFMFFQENLILHQLKGICFASLLCLQTWQLWIVAAEREGRDKLTETAVEKILLSGCQNLEAHSVSVYLGR